MKKRSKATDLERLQTRFESWRNTRKRGERIPISLWNAAAGVAAAEGICKTAQALRLEYYALKRRVDGMKQQEPAMPAFVELPQSQLIGSGEACQPECTIELESMSGASMRMHFKGIDFTSIASLSQVLWKGK